MGFLAQWVKELAVTCDVLSLSPMCRMVEGKHQLSQVVP